MGYKILITAPTLADRAMAMLDALEATVFTIPDGAPDSLIYDIAAREQIDGIIVRIGEIDATVIDASANLRVLSKNGIGVDNVDVAHATRKGIPVVNGRNSNSQSVAEHALGMMIALMKDFRRLDNSVRNGNWEKATYQGIELQGKHVGLIGFGGNGRALAKLLLPFGVRISAYDPYLEDDAFFEGITRAATLDDFVADIDILSIHCPRTQETENMVDAARFAQMKSSAYLVNCARGGIVDETALVAALQFGDIAAAGIDVFDVEAPPKDHPLWQLSNVLLSPHIAGVTHESFERMGTMAVENAYKILNGEPIDPDCVVNPEALA
jgi:D-3-phosphoglycerate dehydrogenase